MSNKKPFFFSHIYGVDLYSRHVIKLITCPTVMPPPLKVKELFLISSTYVSSLEETLKSK